MENNGRQARENQPNHGQCQVKNIDVLPDDVLLDVFDFYTKMCGGDRKRKRSVEAWQTLVHVCRRWRWLVFQSPCRLELQLYCTPETPAEDTLDVWPALPLIVNGDMYLSTDTDNIITALGQNSRVCELNLSSIMGGNLPKVLATMQVPFPELREMSLISKGETMPVIPDSFLGGSAPRLRVFALDGILFPGLRKLLLSTTQLVDLRLIHSCISPEEMVSLISMLSSLETLTLGLQFPQSHPSWESRSLPLQKRSILPALNRLSFKGNTKYLEELVSCIDTPQLYHMHLTFFNQIAFNSPQLTQFIHRTPELTMALDRAVVYFNDSTVGFALRHGISIYDLDISISCRDLDLQLWSIEQICNSSLHPLSTVEALYIERDSQLVFMREGIEATLWLQLLHPFTAVKNLYLFKEFAPGIAASLQEHAVTEVLPNLQNIFVQEHRPSGSFRDSIGQFVDARQLSGRPIAISLWDIDA